LSLPVRGTAAGKALNKLLMIIPHFIRGKANHWRTAGFLLL